MPKINPENAKIYNCVTKILHSSSLGLMPKVNPESVKTYNCIMKFLHSLQRIFYTFKIFYTLK